MSLFKNVKALVFFSSLFLLRPFIPFIYVASATIHSAQCIFKSRRCVRSNNSQAKKEEKKKKRSNLSLFWVIFFAVFIYIFLIYKWDLLPSVFIFFFSFFRAHYYWWTLLLIFTISFIKVISLRISYASLHVTHR
jgi:hypothetical protein